MHSREWICYTLRETHRQQFFACDVHITMISNVYDLRVFVEHSSHWKVSLVSFACKDAYKQGHVGNHDRPQVTYFCDHYLCSNTLEHDWSELLAKTTPLGTVSEDAQYLSLIYYFGYCIVGRSKFKVCFTDTWAHTDGCIGQLPLWHVELSEMFVLPAGQLGNSFTLLPHFDWGVLISWARVCVCVCECGFKFCVATSTS